LQGGVHDQMIIIQRQHQRLALRFDRIAQSGRLDGERRVLTGLQQLPCFRQASGETIRNTAMI
jgi:hypothetical protein